VAARRDRDRGEEFLAKLKIEMQQEAADAAGRSRSNPFDAPEALGQRLSLARQLLNSDDPQALQFADPALHVISKEGRNFLSYLRDNDPVETIRQRPSIRSGEAKTDLKRRFEGVEIKHWVEKNSIKMYDKQGSVLRIETTINNPKRFRVRHRADNKGPMKWPQLRKGIADIRRRVEISRAANERYLQALAVMGETTPSHKLLDRVSTRVKLQKKNFRALRPISPEDSKVFSIILRGDYLLQGFRNKDLRQRLYPQPDNDVAQVRKNSGRTTRYLSLLQSHQLLYLVPHTITTASLNEGHEVMTTALKFRETNLALLAA
jgi:hypothetical protein